MNIAAALVAVMAFGDFAAAVAYWVQGDGRLGTYWAAAGVIAICMYK